ncbi:MAG TPA: cytochrome c biogenesis protein CcdA, partial [Nitrososphaeraceae archaeon]|nr:cytochrome c biogenesis protein CcdA [Nitrososphaeraceae archaeon]
MAEISIIVSAIAGMGSFFSPCILPILPAFISYLSGTTLHELGNLNSEKTSIDAGDNSINSNNNKKTISLQKSTRLNIFLNTVYFVLGFSL